MKKERLIIPERDQSKIAKPRPNGVTFEQALYAEGLLKKKRG